MSARLDDRADLLADVDLPALWLELVGPRGKNRLWPCPAPTHPQSGATPPVSIVRHPDGARWKCFGCDASGSAVDLLMLAQGLDVAAAFAELRRRTGRPLPERSTGGDAHMPQVAARQAPPPSVLEPVPGPPSVLAAFVDARGWDPAVVERFGLSVVLDSRRRPRVRIPFRCAGETVWHQDRATRPADKPKFRSPTGRGAIPFAFDLDVVLAEIAATSTAVVVEGPVDAIALAHVEDWAGITLGLPGVSTIRPDRVAAMIAAAAPGCLVVVAVDADPAGDDLRRHLAAALADAGCTPVHARPPDGLDVDDWRRQLGTDAFADAFTASIVDHLPTVEEVAA